MGDYRLGNGDWPNWLDRYHAGAAPRAARSKHYRSIWISDVHLGTRVCKAEALLAFLRDHQADHLFLVGDIVDGWNLGASWHWSPAQAAVCETIAAWRRNGTRVVFLPGNHDELNEREVRHLFGPIEVVSDLVHRTADGRRMLTIHGHQFDGSLNPNRWMSSMKGRQAYATVLRINEWCNRERGNPRSISLSRYLKYRLRKAVEYLTDFADYAVSEAARQYKADGVICGHIHRAEQRLIGDILYVNDGDWVGNLSAIAEDHDGLLHLLRWNRELGRSTLPDPVGATMGLS